MIDLHSHLLPGLDDGSKSLEMSLAMARASVADGVEIMACTPHIVPGVYPNSAATIMPAVEALQASLDEAGVPLRLVAGADVHVAPDLPERIARGECLTLNGSRYFLFEPTHHIIPPRMEELATRLIKAGIVPIVTHPERLTWIEAHYDVVARLNRMGCLMQLTAASVTGQFGKTAKFYSDRMLDEGRVDIIASDAHNPSSRAPGLARARDLIATRLGETEALRMVLHTPASIISDEPLTPVGKRAGMAQAARKRGLLDRLFGGRRG